ncbi:MAG: FG-GAP-like repeat-containing protein [Oligoflexus sp.]
MIRFFKVVFTLLILFGTDSSHDLLAEEVYEFYKEDLIQAPTILAPEAASIVGTKHLQSLDQVNANGSFSFSLPITPPGNRGKILISMNPEWSPKKELGPIGLGFGWNFTVERTRFLGEINFYDDFLSSPWGLLKKGKDQFWYPIGSPNIVRVSVSKDIIQAYTNDGLTFVFEIQDEKFANRLWHLVSVRTLIGFRTDFNWKLSEGYVYLMNVAYGSKNKSTHIYQANFSYEPLSNSITQHKYGFQSKLKQRLKKIQFSSNKSELWRYEFNYLDTASNPIFYLNRFTKIFPSGKSDPSMIIGWNTTDAMLQPSLIKTTNKFASILDKIGIAYFKKEYLTETDFNLDGLTDFEVSNGWLHVLQAKDTSFQVSSPELPSASSECWNRKAAGKLSKPLIKLDGFNGAWIRYNFIRKPGRKTNLIVCSQDDQLISQLELPYIPFNNRLRLADVNKDFKPDLVVLNENEISIFLNESINGEYKFSEEISIKTEGRYTPEGFQVVDVDEDGHVDIVAKSKSSLKIFWGLGNLQFRNSPQTIDLYSHRHRLLDITNKSLYFIDINKNGYKDIVALSESYPNILYFNGEAFTEYEQYDFFDSFSRSIFTLLNIDGTQLPEIVQAARNGTVSYVDFDRPEVGKPKFIDDGYGNRLSFTWDLHTPVPYVGKTAVISQLIKSSNGQDNFSTVYSYHEPQISSESPRLLGFRLVEEKNDLTLSQVTYKNFEHQAPIVEKTITKDQLHKSEFEKYEEFKFIFGDYNGVNFQIVSEKTEGLSQAPQKVSSRQTFQYNDHLCLIAHQQIHDNSTLTTILNYKDSIDLNQHPKCIWESKQLSGKHTRRDYDFDYHLKVKRNNFDQIQLVSIGDGKNWIDLQELEYSDNGLMKSLKEPTGIVKHFKYEEETQFITEITDSRGYSEKAALDETGERLLQISQLNGSTDYTQHFGYDDYYRLNKIWDNISQTTMSDPLIQYIYRNASDSHPGYISSAKKLDDFVKKQDVQLFESNGELITQFQKHDNFWIANEVFDNNTLAASSTTRQSFAVFDDFSTLDKQNLINSSAIKNTARSNPILGTIAGAHTVEQGKLKSQKFTYRLADNRLEVTEKINDLHSIIRSFDKNGNLTSLTDQEKATFKYEYDALGRIRYYVSPKGHIHSVNFDSFGRIAENTRKNLTSVRYRYKNDSTLLQKKEYLDRNENLSRTVEFKYDSNGRITNQLNSNSTSTEDFSFYYDGQTSSGTKIDDQIGFLTEEKGSNYQIINDYRADGKLKKQTLNLLGKYSVTRHYNYMLDGSLKAENFFIENKINGKRVKLGQEYKLNTDGKPKLIHLSDGTILHIFYNEQGDLEAIGPLDDPSQVKFDPITKKIKSIQTKNSSYSISFNTFGNIDFEEFQVSGKNKKRDYDYSARDFLISDHLDTEDSHYSYDLDGLSDDEEFQSFSISNIDALGRLTKKNGWKLKYGPDSNLQSASKNDEHIEFIYDSNGQRLAKLKNDKISYVKWGNLLIYDDKPYLTIKFNGLLLGLVTEDEFKPLNSDIRGTPFSDLNGELDLANPWGLRSKANFSHEILNFVAQGLDADLRLVRFGVRDYDPEMLSFTSPDPLFLENLELCIESPIECNLYSYAQNNPLKYTDSTGMCTSCYEGSRLPEHNPVAIANKQALIELLSLDILAIALNESETAERRATASLVLAFEVGFGAKAVGKLSSAGMALIDNAAAKFSRNSQYVPDAPLLMQRVKGQDIPLPDSRAQGASHTVLGGRVGGDGVKYRQSATFSGSSWPRANNQDVPLSRVDWSNHGRPHDHPDVHQHIFSFDRQNNMWKEGPPAHFWKGN